MFTSLALYMAFGAIAGILAGLLGIGGGLIIVPIMLYTLPMQGISEYVNQLALGTSMASILFTSLSSVRAHNAHGTVLWRVVGRFAPGIIIGTFAGGSIAAVLPAKPLSLIFVVFLVYVAFQMLLNLKAKPSRHLPGTPGLVITGTGIGFVSSFVGIGGGTLTVPILSMCNVNMREAIGTSAGTGFPIAAAGAATYIYNGWGMPGLPEYSFGFIYLPALLGLAAASILMAPLGARIAYKLPVAKLKRFFAIFLIIVAANMIWKLL